MYTLDVHWQCTLCIHCSGSSVAVCQCVISVLQCILAVYFQYTLNTLEFDLGFWLIKNSAKTHARSCQAWIFSRHLFSQVTSSQLAHHWLVSFLPSFLAKLLRRLNTHNSQFYSGHFCSFKRKASIGFSAHCSAFNVRLCLWDIDRPTDLGND